MESDLRILETNIVSAILPVRDKLHKQWQRMSQAHGLAASCASSVSSSSVSSSTKTSKEDSVSDTPSGRADGTGLIGVTTIQSGSEHSELASSSKKKETSNKAKNSKGIKYQLFPLCIAFFFIAFFFLTPSLITTQTHRRQ